MPSVRHSRQHALGDAPSLAVRQGRRPDPRSAVLTFGTGPLEVAVEEVASEIERQIACPGASQADNGQSAARADEAAHSLERWTHVHVVERRDRDHEVERLGLERVGHEVAVHVRDVPRRPAPGHDEAGLVPVDADDVGDTLTKALGEAPLAAAHVQRMRSVVRERLQDDGVVVDVVIPGLDPVDPPTDGMGESFAGVLVS